MSKLQTNHEMVMKVVFVGDSCVGKTSLLRRETEQSFTNEYICTIGVDFKIKKYQVGKISVKAQLWDTAGQERFRSIQKPYYRGSHAIMLCFSLADRQSFDSLPRWLDQITNFDIQGLVYLVGCKSDLEIAVPTDQILTFAQAYGVNYVQTSAKENVGVSESFQRVIEQAVQSNLIKMAFDSKQKDVLREGMNDPPKKKGCC